MQANGTSPIVLHASGGGKLTDSRYAGAVKQAADAVAKAPHVASVVSPLTQQGAGALSKDQTTGYLTVGLDANPGDLSVEDAEAIIDAAKGPAEAAGLEVQTGGQLGQKVSQPATESSELVGIIAAMAILTFTFGTVTAMLVPILTAIVALATTLAIVRMLGHVLTVPSIAPTLATMIGLGVGIDYALFIVTRHFRGLDARPPDGRVDRARDGDLGRRGVLRGLHGDDRARLARDRADPARHDDGAHGGGRRRRRGARRPDAAARDASRSLGSGINALRVRRPQAGVGRPRGHVGALRPRDLAPPAAGRARRARDPHPAHDPALLAQPRPEGRRRAVGVDDRAPGLRPARRGASGRARTGRCSIAVTLGSPAQPAAGGQQPPAAGPGQPQGDPRTTDPRLTTLQQDVKNATGVAAVSPIQIDKAGTTAFFNAISDEGPAEDGTTALVNRLRDTTIPGAEQGTDLRAHVGGSTAAYDRPRARRSRTSSRSRSSPSSR